MQECSKPLRNELQGAAAILRTIPVARLKLWREGFLPGQVHQYALQADTSAGSPRQLTWATTGSIEIASDSML